MHAETYISACHMYDDKTIQIRCLSCRRKIWQTLWKGEAWK